MVCIKQLCICFSISMVTHVMLDIVWFLFMADRFYGVHLGHLFGPKINLISAMIAYLLSAFGITLFVLLPHLHDNTSLLKIGSLGFLLGMVVYGVYNASNQATLRDWPTIVFIVDTFWGSIVFGLVSVICYWILSFLKR